MLQPAETFPNIQNQLAHRINSQFPYLEIYIVNFFEQHHKASIVYTIVDQGVDPLTGLLPEKRRATRRPVQQNWHNDHQTFRSDFDIFRTQKKFVGKNQRISRDARPETINALYERSLEKFQDPVNLPIIKFVETPLSIDSLCLRPPIQFIIQQKFQVIQKFRPILPHTNRFLLLILLIYPVYLLGLQLRLYITLKSAKKIGYLQ